MGVMVHGYIELVPDFDLLIMFPEYFLQNELPKTKQLTI